MSHPFMAAIANDLAARGIATLRYQFPYMERGGKRPDAPPLCHATVRAAVLTARKLAPRLVLVGGRQILWG
jgi:predicted alpha/beta-hydrolase family hydrolase